MKYILELKGMDSRLVKEEVLQIVEDIEMMLDCNGTKHGEVKLTLVKEVEEE